MKSYLELLTREIKLQGLSTATNSAYRRQVKGFLNYSDVDPKDRDLEDIKDYLLHLQGQNSLGRKTKPTPSTINGVASALKFFYLFVLKINYTDQIPRMKYSAPAATILSIEEVNLMINTVHNIFWKALLMTIYTTGMRQSEVRHLKFGDIDSGRMVFYIRNSKGAKDRQAAISPTVLSCLRTYWRLCRKGAGKEAYVFVPTKNVYNGRVLEKLSHTAVSYIVKRAAELAGIKKKFTLTA
jgi:integrase/recombinase XerD